MSLSPGVRLGAYEVTALIGEGGMGKVWRARHTALKRDDALKVLPDAFASDPDRLARFQREAQVLASLNHPNIARVYGLEQADGVQALVMELVEGPTLADRIARGPIPLDEALPIAKQIAEALESAHDQGIIHRDLKPANIKVTPDGTVKVLDFGLAKLAESSGSSTTDASLSPTITSPALMTGIGVLLGTAAYMSPEQAKGRPADKRSDIWAFGCVLFEMLTGKRAFDGEDVTETLTALLRDNPDWTRLPSNVPHTLVRLTKRCLEKDRGKRLHDIADARIDIEEALTAPVDEARTQAPSSRISIVRRFLPYAAVAVASAAVASYAVWMRQPAVARPVLRLAMSWPADQQFPSFARPVLALSPAGNQLVYVADNRLYLRSLDQLDAVPLRGTEAPSNASIVGPRNPFFAPDGQWIGFWQGGQLKKISVSGGAPVTLCDAEIPWGATWDSADAILYGEGEKGIWSVRGAGGVPKLIIRLETGEQAYGPQPLPGGDWVMFTLLPKGATSWDEAQIVAQSLTSGERRVLIKGGRDGRYLSTGHLLYGLKGTLLAVPFDPHQLEVAAGPVPLVEGIALSAVGGAMQFALAGDGTLAYVSARAAINRGTLVWVSREGRELTSLSRTTLDNPLFPRLSPDGRRLALAVAGDLWVYDVEGRPPIKLTSQAGVHAPLWSPDGRRLVYEATAGGILQLMSIPADGSGNAPEPVTPSGAYHPRGWSSEGRDLVVTRLGTPTPDIMRIPLGDKAEPQPVVQTQYNEGGEGAALSPDGRWLAYASDQTGQQEIWVRPYPGPGAAIRVSPNGGVDPVWARDGRALYYLEDTKMMSVAVVVGAGFNFKAPNLMFESGYRITGDRPAYDVAPDGRFLMIKAGESQAAVTQIVLVQNWTEELKRLVPTH